MKTKIKLLKKIANIIVIIYLLFICSNTIAQNTEIAGKLTIVSARSAVFAPWPGMTGHAWIEYTSNDGETTTYGFWPNGLHVNEIENTTYSDYVSRTVDITYDQLFNLENVVDWYDYNGIYTGISTNCVTFADDAWNAATSENLYSGYLSLPGTLYLGIEMQNYYTDNNGGIIGSNDGSGSIIVDAIGNGLNAYCGGGTGGGIESHSLKIQASSFLNTLKSLENLDEYKKNSTPGSVLESITLADILPDEGLVGTQITSVNPTFVSLNSDNVIDKLAKDFTINNKIVGSAFGITTTDKVYSHDKPICDRFHGYTLETIVPVPFDSILYGIYDTTWFWYLSARKDKMIEESILFNIFVNENQKTFTVDSRWLSHFYPDSNQLSYDYVFNMQVWSVSSEITIQLMKNILNKLNSINGWTLVFANKTKPIEPSVIFKTAQIVGNKAHLTLHSWLNEEQSLNFYVSYRNISDYTTGLQSNYQAIVKPGYNSIDLPVGNIIDGVIDIDVNGFEDKVYVGQGFWFKFNDSLQGNASTVNLTVPDTLNIGSNLTNEDYIIPKSAKMTGKVGKNGYVGIGNVLNPNGLPLDLSDFKAISFFAKGDGKSYKINVESDAVNNIGSTDFHNFIFTTTDSSFRQYVIPFKKLKQLGWDSSKIIPFTGTDIKALAFTSLDSPHDSINLELEDIAFLNSTIISNTTLLTNTINTTDPYVVTSEVADDKAITSVSLFYSIDGGITFNKIPMELVDDNKYRASIPGHPLNTEIRYYIKATDAEGNVGTDPIDIPYTTYRFQVSEYPDSLVDDYYDTNPDNVIGGKSFIFESETGTVVKYFNKEYLTFKYYDPKPESWSGWVTLLNDLDASNFNALTFLVKGIKGDEKAKIGLKDNTNYERNILMSEYLHAGITNEWQEVVIPLNAYGTALDKKHLNGIIFTFESAINSQEGEIYIDDLKLEHVFDYPLVIDNFNNEVNRNGVGRSVSTAFHEGVDISTSYISENAMDNNGSAFLINYDKITEDKWAMAEWDLYDLDASGYDYLSMQINPSGIGKANVYLVNYSGSDYIRRYVDIENYTTSTESWKSIHIPLKDFEVEGIDLSKLFKLQIAFEWEPMNGQILLDNIMIHNDLRLNKTIKNISCKNGDDGEIGLKMQGGVSPYTIVCSNGSNSEDLKGLLPGSYIVSVSDWINNQITDTTVLIEPQSGLSINFKEYTLENGEKSLKAIVLGGTPPYNYQWSHDAVIHEDSISIGFVGRTYSLFVTDNNNCSISDSISVQKTTDGVNDIDELADLNIFPNPTTGRINVLLNLNERSEIILAVFDVLGIQHFVQTDISSGNKLYEIDLGTCKEGIYFLKLTINKKSIIKKIIAK